MKVQELRIGNLFQEQKTKKIIEVIELSQEKIVFSGVFSAEWQAEPIPLTEEWLLKFGFIDFEKESFSYYIENNGEIVLKKSGLDILYDYPIQYVHQLQNLYFDLTGEELSVIN